MFFDSTKFHKALHWCYDRRIYFEKALVSKKGYPQMFKVVRKMQGKSTEGTLVYASSEIDEAIEKLYVTTYLSNQTNCQQT